MDLGLDTTRTRGRAAKPVQADLVRDLTIEDLGLLQQEKGSTTPALKRLTQRHHGLARVLASGVKDWEAVIITGYTASRISILKADPSFADLVKFYQEDRDAQYTEMHERLAGLATDAIELLRDRLEDDPDSISNSMLLEIMTKTADRSGNGPTSTTNNNVNVTVGIAERLEAARKRVAAGKVIEHDDRPQEHEGHQEGEAGGSSGY